MPRAAAMPMRPATMPKTEAMPMPAIVEKMEIETAQEQAETKKPINKTLLIGGGLAAVAALYFFSKKRKK
jgi:LPXTG-motif cell wall-anchored protein